MKSEQILSADLLDILFENRNKSYGAYSIRRAYPSHLKKAMATMLLLAGIASVIVMSQPKKPSERAITIILKPDLELDKVKEIEKPKEKKSDERTVAEQPPTKPDFVPKIVDDQLVINKVPDRTDTAKYNPGPIEDPGTPGGEELMQANKGQVTNITPEPTQTSVQEEPVIVEFPEEKPEFPGGIAEWATYLQRMLRVPDDLESGDRKTVRVKFVVNINGDVTDVVISQSAGVEFDREVLRVIGRMPKWKPGKQRGKPVPSYFTQPVTFTALEE